VLFHAFWAPPHVDLTKAPNVVKVLSEAPADFTVEGPPSRSSGRLFRAEDVDAIAKGMASPEIKDALRATTQQALDQGAFGAPWMWVTNSAGVTEPFFGSDRYGSLSGCGPGGLA
jgi:glutathione S-transferase kappa 1